MRRRGFLTLLGGAAAALPRFAFAQPADRMRRIGVLLGFASDADGRNRLDAFRNALQDLGWVEGRNLRIDLRWAADNAESRRATVAELIAAAPEVIFASPAPVVRALRQQTWTLPIVFVQSGDPVQAGFVMSHAKPGGNATGFLLFEPSINTKYLQLLKDIAPRVTRAAVMSNPDNTAWRSDATQFDAAGRSLGVVPVATPMRDSAGIERAIAVFANEPNGGLIFPPDLTALHHRDAIIRLAAKHRLPAIYATRIFVSAGGLMCYGVDAADIYRRAAGYVDRVLRGEKPGELPVQAPTKFELVINLKTARALGLDVPLAMLARADEVIE
jgi:putative tryptophan/tyrosine transport system substrate-binding protein